jgi:diguanylate cyclase (GGDEF)-like protein
MRSSGETTEARPATLPLALLGVLAVALAVRVAVPMPEVLAGVSYDAVAVGSVLVGFLGIRRNRPEAGRAWALVLAGYASWVLGDIAWTVERAVFPGHYPTPSDGIYLASYLLLCLGGLAFARTRRRRDLDVLLDAAIVTAGAGVVVAVFVVAPVAADSALSLSAKLVTSAYPLGDLFFLGVLARLVAAGGARTASFRLLTGSLVATLAADLAWNLDVLTPGSYAARWNSGLWLLGYLLFGAAATVGSMRQLGAGAPRARRSAPSRRRLAVLGAGLMLPGVTLVAEGAAGGTILWPVIGLGSLVLSALVLLRMVRLLRTVQRQAERLGELAGSDSLTGAPNRRGWDDALARAVRHGQEHGTTLSVAVLDLDHFKAFNDEHGHQAGDRLLQAAVTAWTGALPEGVTLARYGGEEFALLLPATTPEQAADVVHRLREVTPDGRTFSAGVAACAPGTDPAAAVAAADAALYAAKRAGRNRVVVHTPQDVDAARALPSV